MSIQNAFWKDRRVFLTGHTGFKGSWLSLWLHSLGARVHGYALEPPTDPSLFALASVGDTLTSTIADILDRITLESTMRSFEPEIVIHMAAQPLVRESYRRPVDTYHVNVMGTVLVLEAVRACPSVKSVINVTTDKCYENHEWVWGYRESDPLGGYDQYSTSKACSELVTAAYRSSFFNPRTFADHGVGIATARAGNVIGGGDWASDRIVPDCVRALLAGEPVRVRNPQAIRPWQHVLEPLSGYLRLAEKLYENGASYSDAWNFGPDEADTKPVEWLVRTLCARWGTGASWNIDDGAHPHEAGFLKLECSKARSLLRWQPRWNIEKAIDSIVEWTRAYQQNKDTRTVCLEQIRQYEEKAVGN